MKITNLKRLLGRNRDVAKEHCDFGEKFVRQSLNSAPKSEGKNKFLM